jgi:hypothetical protein
VAVPSSPLSKEPPVDDWERQQRKQQRRRARREFIKEYLSGFLGLASILLMTVLVFAWNWNLWLIPIGITALIGLIIAAHMHMSLGESLGLALNIVCLLMIICYGLSNIDANAGSTSTVTAEVCSITRNGNDGYPVLVTSKGTYTITDGTYNGVNQPTADGAASMLATGHTYQLKTYSGSHTYADITGGKEVPNTGQKCSTR